MPVTKEHYLIDSFWDLLPEANHKGRLQFRPEGSALLVLDMQRFFLEKSSHAFIPAARATVPGIVELVTQDFLDLI